MTSSRRWVWVTSTVLLLTVLVGPAAPTEYGHSRHGSAFDAGFRQKPWKMEGLGHAPFPISTKNPEVQVWYDQANALLWSFWFEEAERSLRWCLKLDPENAMVYWGLARCGLNWFSINGPSDPNLQRFRDFLKEAVKRKDSVPGRERLYIEAWDSAFIQDTDDRLAAMVRKLQDLCLKYPDDIEAKALLALFNIWQGSALANETLIQQVLTVNPMHPGAHHIRIHNWDGVASDQAIVSCVQYGKAAPGIGHSLHMPGHIYSKVGMWHEAAIAMDSATRVELRYMNERLALPFETWNYAHNRNYLCYIQEQLGMADASLHGARDLLSAPRDPSLPYDDAHQQGITAMCRALVKFERWENILRPGFIPWHDSNESERQIRALVESLALAGTGKLEAARERFAELKKLTAPKSEQPGPPDENAQASLQIVEGLIARAEGKVLDAQRLLLAAMETDDTRRSAVAFLFVNDPPDVAWPVARLVGDLYRERGDHRLAIEAYELALRQEPNDGFTLAGLAAAHQALGEAATAATYYGRLLYVWSEADPSLRWMTEARALGLHSEPIGETPANERAYDPAALDRLGPSNWTPCAAPALDGLDADGQHVRLEDYRGTNVLLVFYLSDECAHCVEQLVAINGRAAELAKQNTVVLAVSSAGPEINKASQTLGGLQVRLLTDTDHQNARRFASYDDFEDLELHSTILIDAAGRVRWKRTGGDPFSDMNFLFGEIARLNAPAALP